MLSIINCITEPYLLQSYIFYMHVYRLKGNSPCPRLFLCQTSGRSPGLWFILRTPSRFRSDFFVLCPQYNYPALIVPDSHIITVEAAAGDFHPTSLTVFHFSVPDRLFSRCCKFSVEPLKGYHFLSDFAIPFYYTAMFVFLYTFLLSFLSLQKKE